MNSYGVYPGPGKQSHVGVQNGNSVIVTTPSNISTESVTAHIVIVSLTPKGIPTGSSSPQRVAPTDPPSNAYNS